MRTHLALALPIALLGCGEASRAAGGGGAGGGGGSGGIFEGEGEGTAEGEGEGGMEGEGEGEGGMEGEGEGEGVGPGPRGCATHDECGEGMFCVGGRCFDPGGGQEPDPEEPPLPTEELVDFGPVPVQGDRYVFVALPGTPALARIDTENLAVDEVPLSDEARAVTTLTGRDVAVVLLGSGLAAVVGSEDEGDAVVAEVVVQPDLTHLTAAEGAPYVVAWADHDSVLALERGNLSEVSVIDLTDATDLLRVTPNAWHLSVGTRPRDVVFDRAGRRLFVVTDDGISAVDVESLRGDAIVPPLPVHEDGLAEPAGRRVIITPDGAYALVLQPGDTALRLVDLDAETAPVTLDLQTAPTDVALIPSDDPALDGRRAVVVLRTRQQAALIDVPGDFTGGEVEVAELGQVAGQVTVSATGDSALLFSSASEAPVVVRLDVREGVSTDARVHVERLAAPVKALRFAPDGKNGVAFHRADGPDAPLFSMLSFEDGFFAKPFAPGGEAGAFTFTPPGAAAEPQLLLLIAEEETSRYELLSIPTASFIPEVVRLRAPPVDVGVIAATGQAFVTQDDPEGLITFIDLSDSLQTREVSRFRRNRRID